MGLRTVRRQTLARYLSILFISLFFPLTKSFLGAQLPAEGKETHRVDYANRLSFYLNRLSKTYLLEMADQEAALLQMIKSIRLELRGRKKHGFKGKDAGFAPLYRDMEKNVLDYTQELNQIVSLIGDVEVLKRTLAREKRFGMAGLFSSLKDSLVYLLDNKNLHNKIPEANDHITEILKDYSVQVDTLLLSSSMRPGEAQAGARGTKNQQFIRKINSLQKKVLSHLEKNENGKRDAESKLAQRYFEEANQLVELLDELSGLQNQIFKADKNVSRNTEEVRKTILGNLDERVQLLLGQEAILVDSVALSDMFHRWRNTRVGVYQAKYHEYLVIKNALLKSASTGQRKRMLERDITDALLAYAEEKFSQAELQFNRILADYKNYFEKFDAVQFYRAESQFARLHYEQAYHNYVALLESLPDSQFRDELYLRTITISQIMSWHDRFISHYQNYLKHEASINSKIRNRINYIAGYTFLESRKRAKAAEALEKIDKKSRYFLPGLYLQAITKANQGKYDTAIGLFETIVGMKNWPWSKYQLAIIRNNAMLRLGLIHYERQNFDQALAIFQKISKGVDNRDQLLISAAWASMKSGDYDQTITSVNKLFSTHLTSSYTYEALVLAAHCKRLLNQPDDALKDLRYVTNARGVLELANQHTGEREHILQQLDELESLETEALNMQDKSLFKVIAEVRKSGMKRLATLGRGGVEGANLFDGLENEKQEIYKQIRELDQVMSAAGKAGKNNVLSKAKKRRERLVRTLISYQSEKAGKKSNFFKDFPLASREGSSKYQKRILQDMLRSMQVEKQRVQQNLAKITALIEKDPKASTYIDLTALKTDLAHLEDRIDRLQTWLTTYRFEEVKTNFDHWADFSGFGMSDITINEINSRQKQIGEYAENVISIDRLMAIRKAELENRLQEFDKEMEKIRLGLEKEYLKLKKLEKENFFKTKYFDTTTSEVEEQGFHN